MCGLVGIVDFRSGARVERETIERMCELVAHRGPNHEGVRVEAGCGLGHRRLTITDLVTGQQPLANEDGTVWVVFNGEIYNYREQRARLEDLGHKFVTQTDTEVIPHLYEEHGDDFVDHLEGNWAIALWDEKRRRLVLTRDRLGKKPLVWMCSDGVLRFASEAKALFADSSLPREPDPNGLLDVIHHGHTVEDRTMFKGVAMVLPATMLVFEDGKLASERRYWDFADVPRFEGDWEDAIDEFSTIFSDVTRQRLIGDVPYGLLLSGGIDSSLVASYIIEHEPDLKTYVIARGDDEDETHAAGLMAKHIGSKHHVVPPADGDPAAIAARIPWMFDQPFYNDASIANYLLSHSISGEVTVGITGDGGDHTFSGTLRHVGDTFGREARRAPRQLVAAAVSAADAATRVTTSRRVRQITKGLSGARLEDRQRWLSLRQHDLPIRRRQLLATAAWKTNGHDPDSEALAHYDRSRSPDHLNRLLYAETKFDLPPNDLLKVDRMAMYNQTAGRAPFLDRRVVEFAAGIPADWKRSGRRFKVFLREVARRRLPAEVAGLPKVGLAVPLRDWLRGPLGDRVGNVLRSDSFASRGVFDREGALAALESHRSGRGDFAYTLWTMAMTELWYRSFVDSFGQPDERIWE
jgi:asparagine synthase (glutamine-hydrolysing)